MVELIKLLRVWVALRTIETVAEIIWRHNENGVLRHQQVSDAHRSPWTRYASAVDE